ncbi:phosphotransferase [Enterococcus sp. DIV1368b]
MHGDLHKRNFILSKDNKFKIIDFDQSTYFPASC